MNRHTRLWVLGAASLRVAALLCWMAVVGRAAPFVQQQAQVLDVRTAHSAHLAFLLFSPAGYKQGTATWPLILYLHGGSLRGNDVERLRTLGLPHKLESEPDFPCFVVSPQCPEGEIWTEVETVDALLDHLIEQYRIDPGRIYITGHSMGGRGALYFAYRLPRRFAAVLALSPYSPIDAWAPKLASTPVWIFQGDRDDIARPVETESLVRAIQRAGGDPHFDVLAGRDHFILDVYDRKDVWEWLLSQCRPKMDKRAVDPGN